MTDEHTRQDSISEMRELREADEVSSSSSNDVLCTVKYELLKRTYFALETARDNAAECLNNHMAGLGTTTAKNERLAKLYNEDLDEVEALISLLSDEYEFGV